MTTCIVRVPIARVALAKMTRDFRALNLVSDIVVLDSDETSGQREGRGWEDIFAKEAIVKGEYTTIIQREKDVTLRVQVKDTA